MAMSKEDVDNMTDLELEEAIKKKGIEVMPIISSTRQQYKMFLMKNSDDCNPTHKSVEQDDSNFEPDKQEESLSNSNEIYAIYVAASDTTNFSDMVFNSKEACLAQLRKYKGARFKAFQNHKDALNFTIYGPGPVGRPVKSSGSTSLREERPSPFSTPTPQLYVRFRKVIERGDLRLFNELVEENPRYLVSKADSPAILKEGPRYNAIHVACIYNKPQLCSEILEIMSSPAFFKRIYPDDTDDCAKKRASHLLDLYLNTPDKGFNRTPLHYASCFGFLDCIKVLVSYSNCDKKAVDKYNDTAIKVILSRATKIPTEEVRAEIEMLLGDHYYVPIFHDEEKLFSPKIGQPMSPSVPISPPAPVNVQLNDSLGGNFNPSYKLHGYAGPMSPQQAHGFYSKWRSPIPSSPLTPSRVKIEDNNLDCIGRDLAHDLKLPWKEYWEFLGQFINITSTEGLEKLEEHLQRMLNKVLADKNEERNADFVDDNAFNSDEDDLPCENISEIPCSTPSTIGSLCRGFSKLHLHSPLSSRGDVNHLQDPADTSSEILNNNSLHADSDDDAFDYMNFVLTSASTSAAKIASFFDRRDEPPQIEMIRWDVSKALEDLRVILYQLNAERQLDFSFVHATMASTIVEKLTDGFNSPGRLDAILSKIMRSRTETSHFECLCTKMVDVTVRFSKNRETLPTATISRCECEWSTVPVRGIKYQKAKTFINRLFRPGDGEISVVRQLSFLEGGRKTSSSSEDGLQTTTSSEDGSDSFVTVATSNSDSMGTPQELFTFFIYGSVASKTDDRVFSAIKKIELDHEKYPFISQWFGIVSLYAASLRNTWPVICEKTAYNFASSPQFTNVISSTPKRLRESFQSHFDSRF